MALTAFTPRYLIIRSPDRKKKYVIKHSTANATIVTTIGAVPLPEAKFIAAAIVPGPASMGMASGETALLQVAIARLMDA